MAKHRTMAGSASLVLLVVLATSAFAQDAAPALPYWRLWTGVDGQSHLSQCSMGGFAQSSAGGQWLRRETGSAALAFAVDPKGDWHESPVVQWVTVVQGAFYLKTQDGAEATLEPGDLLLAEDLHTTPDAQGQKGHVSASRGDKPVALMFVQFPDRQADRQPCHVK